jgi:hypothetical protein
MAVYYRGICFITLAPGLYYTCKREQQIAHDIMFETSFFQSGLTHH